jgi:histidinol-phosphate aminotransferase
VLAAIITAAADVYRYPDITSMQLAEAVSHRHRVDVEQIITGCGSASVLQRLIDVTCTAAGDLVMFGWPSFEAYPSFAAAAGAGQQRVPLTAGGEHDLDAMVDGIGRRTRMILLSTPHNPTGTAVRAAQLHRFLIQVPPDALVVLDEAYIEFATDADVANGMDLARAWWRSGHHNVAVTRTFSKAYGLAGLRVGYGVAPAPLAGATRRRALPFEVNRLGQAAAVAALGADDAMIARRDAIALERRRVQTALTALGLRTPPSQANFVWLDLGTHAVGFEQHCRGYGVTALCYPGNGVRVTVGTHEENSAFLAAAAAWPGAVFGG